MDADLEQFDRGEADCDWSQYRANAVRRVAVARRDTSSCASDKIVRAERSPWMVARNRAGRASRRDKSSSPKEGLIKIGTKVVSYGRSLAIQMAGIEISPTHLTAMARIR